MNILTLSIDKTSNVPILLGGTTTFTLKIKNISEYTRLYNLNVYLTLPDGMTFYDSTIPETSKVTNSDKSTKSFWINLKDLSPMELDYTFDITVKGNTNFENGQYISFGYIFNQIIVKCEMDTMPRGNYDVGNKKESAETMMTFKATRFYNIINTSNKVLKGAGTSISTNDYLKIYTATFKFFNNSISTSSMNITLLLENGIRYLGSITVSGTDGPKFLYPRVTYVNINGKEYIKLYYGDVTLSKNSNTTLNFKYSVWNRYNENTGDIINHGTNLNILSNMSSVDESVDNSFSFLAMDLIITTYVDKQSVDIDDILQFNYTYELGGYYDMKDIDVGYILPDGISYLSSSIEPYYAEDKADIKAFELRYYFAMANIGTSNTINIKGKVNNAYRYKVDKQLILLPVVSFDKFKASIFVYGKKIQNANIVTDSERTYFNIKMPTIVKEFLGGYYRDGTLKNIKYLSQGDLAEYKLTYDARNLKAVQRQIYLDDFFPLCTDPINNLNYVITGYRPTSSPQLIDPHGVDFYYGDIPGNSLSIITFKVPIKYLKAAAENINLLKLKGLNTDGFSYSNRAQVDMNIGSPNIELTKKVSGPNINAIKCGEIYSFTVKISNTNNLGTETDAFNFDLSDELSYWFGVNKDSILVTGSGSFGRATYDDSKIEIPIYKLAPGNVVTLNYSVTIISLIAPAVYIKSIAKNTNPYSQIYDPLLENYQYTELNKTASTVIRAQNVLVNKVSNTNFFKLGSDITYIITVTVPIGTSVHELCMRDVLPNGNQIYNGSAFRNEIPITPNVDRNVITFPNEGNIDARNSAQVIAYKINCKIIAGAKAKDSITTRQNNTAEVFFREKSDSTTWSSARKTLTITINHPNIRMYLSCKDKNSEKGYDTSNNVSVGSTLDFKLEFTNNSNINLVNGILEIPIGGNFIFNSINLANGCDASYDIKSGKIIIAIKNLQPLIWRVVTFTLTCLSKLRAGTTIDTQVTAIRYYNDIWTNAVYGGEQSNICKSILSSDISLLPDPKDRVDDETSYRVTIPGSTMTILNYLKNTGGGYDDYSLSIKPVVLPYTLYIDDIKIGDVPKNTLFNGNLDILKNVMPQEIKVIKIVSLIPEATPLGCEYNFIVTGKSKTYPYREKTVLNIDPT